MVELKDLHNERVSRFLLRFNRSMVELKGNKGADGYEQNWRFNRSMVELKGPKREEYLKQIMRFNRSMVELKGFS